MKLGKLQAVEEELDRERDWHEQTKRKFDDLKKVIACRVLEISGNLNTGLLRSLKNLIL